MNWLHGVSPSRIVLFLTIPLLLYFGLATGSWAVKEYQQRQEEARLKQEVEVEKAKNASLLAQKEYLQSDEYVEKVAREELNLIKPGERAVIVIAPTPSAAETTNQSESKSKKEEPKPAWQRWWDFFFSG